MSEVILPRDHCLILGCEKPRQARGYCWGHLRYLISLGDLMPMSGSERDRLRRERMKRENDPCSECLKRPVAHPTLGLCHACYHSKRWWSSPDRQQWRASKSEYERERRRRKRLTQLATGVHLRYDTTSNQSERDREPSLAA